MDGSILDFREGSSRLREAECGPADDADGRPDADIVQVISRIIRKRENGAADQGSGETSI